jgi:hypothetical protein
MYRIPFSTLCPQIAAMESSIFVCEVENIRWEMLEMIWARNKVYEICKSWEVSKKD